jgi:hypothetical protein
MDPLKKIAGFFEQGLTILLFERGGRSIDLIPAGCYSRG